MNAIGVNLAMPAFSAIPAGSAAVVAPAMRAMGAEPPLSATVVALPSSDRPAPAGAQYASRRLVAAAALALLLWGCGGAGGAPAGGGTTVDRRTAPGGDFALVDQDGRRFTLSRLRGKVVLLYFGYTLCPEACPMMMAKLVRVYDMLGARGANVTVVFVSIDPERDTPPVIKGYLSFFHLPAIGLTGTRQEIDQVVHRYGARYQITKSDSAAGPLVDHSTLLYLIDRHGTLDRSLPHDAPPARVAAEIERLL